MKNKQMKVKDLIARNIYGKYNRSQLDLMYFSQQNYYPQIDLTKIKESQYNYGEADRAMLNNIVRKQKLEEFISIVNQIHRHLSKETMMFMEHEYLNYYDKYWWQDYYSQSTYYRYKHAALDEFLEIARTYWDDDEISKFLK